MNSVYDRLREKYPWPTERPLGSSDAFDWTLDGGGRDLLTSMFKQRNPELMVEVGSFLGGSALRWLRETSRMRLVCVDTWPDQTAEYIDKIADAPWAAKYGKRNLVRYAALIRENGTLKVVQNNLWNYRDRVVLVRKRLQSAIPELTGLEPDVSFIDAMKIREEFVIMDQLFPRAIFTGDDWNWVDPTTGKMPIPEYAGEIAAKRGGRVYGKVCTFLINEPRFNMEFSPAWMHPVE